MNTDRHHSSRQAGHHTGDQGRHSARRRWGVALAGGVVAVACLVPAGAAAAAGTTEPGPRLERACLRIPNMEIRTANLIERLESDSTVIGSLSWLQAQIDRATAGGRTQLAQVLTNRLAVRTSTLDVLHQRQDALPELRQFCIDHGIEL